MKPKLDEEICLFLRDGTERSSPIQSKALQALGINPTEARQRGYPMKEQFALA
jgi:hypothetical protein